ncbi:MAG: GNAT family N-acetyltransferase [Syntrophotaleaceae bacterium]
MTSDADRWRQVLPPECCVMGSLEYVRVIEQQSGFPARLFVWKSEHSTIAYPFFLRPVNTLPFAAGANEPRWDIFTPEYTGPLIVKKGGLSESDRKSFVERFERYCGRNNIVAEFAHMTPWHGNEDLLDPAYTVLNREIVYIDLTMGESALWSKSLTSDTRRMTRQAEKAGVRVRRAESIEDVKAFQKLHASTMDRRKALECYRLPLKYFTTIFESMPNNAFLVLAEFENHLVAGGLFFHGGDDVYWHLSAADMDYSRVRPVNQYLWSTILWAARTGKRRMLLGGGYKEDDGIFRFKAGFSPLRVMFSVHKRIHDETAYKKLATAWSLYYGVPLGKAQFFPAYRSPVEKNETANYSAASG